jgi:hypothetical protein
MGTLRNLPIAQSRTQIRRHPVNDLESSKSNNKLILFQPKESIREEPSPKKVSRFSHSKTNFKKSPDRQYSIMEESYVSWNTKIDQNLDYSCHQTLLQFVSVQPPQLFAGAQTNSYLKQIMQMKSNLGKK